MCYMFRYADRSRSGGAAYLYPLLDHICAMTAALERGLGLSHDPSSLADSCSRSCWGVSLRNSQKLRSGKFSPSSS